MRISDWSSDVCSSDLALDKRKRGAEPSDLTRTACRNLPSPPWSVIFGRSFGRRQCRLASVSCNYPGMMRSEHFGRSIHTLMLFEERANILGKFPEIGRAHV